MRREKHDLGIASGYVAHKHGSQSATLHGACEEQVPIVEIELQILFLKREIANAITLIGVESGVLNGACNRGCVFVRRPAGSDGRYEDRGRNCEIQLHGSSLVRRYRL